MSNTAQATEKKMVNSLGGGASSEVYVRTRPLNEKESAKADQYLSLAAGGSIVGSFLGSRANALYPEKKDYLIAASGGKTVVITGNANLDRRMEPVALGTLVEIVYHGKETIKKGPRKGKETHSFTVYMEEA